MRGKKRDEMNRADGLDLGIAETTTLPSSRADESRETWVGAVITAPTQLDEHEIRRKSRRDLRDHYGGGAVFSELHYETQRVQLRSP